VARTRWPSDLGTPASCTGQADQTGSAGGCQGLGPADRSISRQPERRRPIRRSGRTQASDPTPVPGQNLGSRARSTIHILPADSARLRAVVTAPVTARISAVRVCQVFFGVTDLVGSTSVRR